MASSYEYLPKGTSVDALGYWFPSNHKGPVANDLMVNLTSGANPVLAHMFIDYLLDVNNALENYSYVGYMQPLTDGHPEQAGVREAAASAVDLDGRAPGLLPPRAVPARAAPSRQHGLGEHVEHVLERAVG